MKIRQFLVKALPFVKEIFITARDGPKSIYKNAYVKSFGGQKRVGFVWHLLFFVLLGNFFTLFHYFGGVELKEIFEILVVLFVMIFIQYPTFLHLLEYRLHFGRWL